MMTLNIVWKTTLVVAWKATILNHSHSTICSSHNHGADIADTGLVYFFTQLLLFFKCCDNILEEFPRLQILLTHVYGEYL